MGYQGPTDVAEAAGVSTFNSTTLAYSPEKYPNHQICPDGMAAGVTATITGKALGEDGFCSLPGGSALANNEAFVLDWGIWEAFVVTYSAGGSATASIISYYPALSENR
jgi:hypothetical protein